MLAGQQATWEVVQTSRMLGSIVSHLCRSSLWGSIIFICPDHFVGLFVLWSNWRLRVHVLGHFSKTINLRGHMPRFTLNITFSPSISLETQKCVLKPSEQCSFFWDDRFEGHMPRFTLKMNVFPSISLETPTNVCWNPHNRDHFSQTIDLRGHMPRFTLKMNIFPSISWKTP